VIRAVWSALRSPDYRREMRNYVKWVVRNRKIMPALRQALRGLRERPKYPAVPRAEGDAELAIRKHRFEWPDRERFAGSEADCLAMADVMVKWIRDNPPGGPGWDAYSASRRVSNWIIILSALEAFGDGYRPLRTVNESLDGHARFIRAHLERRGAATNNHLLANGAALYAAGAHLKNDPFLGDGREILQECMKTLFTEEGFLREGSSHYHLIACRNLIETLANARSAGDAVFTEEVNKRLLDALACIHFIIDQGYFHLFGDLSPDIDPAPLLSFIASMFPLSAIDRGSIAGISGAGLYRARNRDWSVFLNAHPEGFVPPGSHGHDDLLGFWLHHKGEPVLADAGRSTYAASPLGRWGRSVRAHNSLSIDGLGPSLVHAHNAHLPLLLAEYYTRPPEVGAKAEGAFTALMVRAAGFRRLHPPADVTRYIFLGHDRTVVEDRLDGTGRHDVEWYFHFHPRIDGEYRIEGPEGAEKIAARGLGGRDPMGWFSCRYGHAVPSTQVRFRERLDLPSTRRFEVKANE